MPCESHNFFTSDMPYRTTYRCVRLGCGLTVRLLNPIDQCSRCGAQMAVVAAAECDLDAFVVAGTADIVAGFDELLRAA